ncbi:hypothetical protein ACJMK2_002855, partial [Sinanodonta woodiana]
DLYDKSFQMQKQLQLMFLFSMAPPVCIDSLHQLRLARICNRYHVGEIINQLDELHWVQWMKWDKLYLVAPSVDDQRVNNLVVYDDVMLDNQKNPARIFSRGRHKNIDVIYVTQRYTQIPKVIRDNCNILAVFNGVDTHTLRNIWQT